MAKVPFSVSWYDIEHVLCQGGLTMASLTEEQINEILFFIGMDLKGIEIDTVLHRPIYSVNNMPWFGERFVGFERQDKGWMLCNKCSLENVILSQDDTEHRKDLMIMSMEMTNTLDACDHIAKHSLQEQDK